LLTTLENEFPEVMRVNELNNPVRANEEVEIVPLRIVTLLPVSENGNE
jgi:hypothetical protein